ICFLIASQSRAATIWNESAQGDLSGSMSAPTSLALSAGDNDLFATTRGGDLEFFTVTVPAGGAMTGLFLRSYVSSDQTAFMALQRGTTFTESPFAPNIANLLGYSHFGPGSGGVGINLLPRLGTAQGAQGFTPPLQADSYTFWLQQLGGTTNYQLDFVVSAPPVPTWNVDVNGNWSAAGNWTGGVPNTVGARAVFGPAITAPRTVAVDVPVTVGQIDFNNANAYTITGANPIALSAASGAGQINVTAGSHAINTTVALASDAVFDVTPAASNLSIGGNVLGVGQNLTNRGAGALSVNQLRAAGLSIDAGKVAVAAGAANGASVVETLSIAGTATAPTAQLDVNGALVVDYSGTSPLATVRSQILAGRGGVGLGATWTGQGIASSAAAAAEPESRSVGFAENATMPLGPYTMFRSQPVDGTSILIAHTRTGDANLDGVVNDDDVTIVGATYGPGISQASWALGDFDYNGFVDDDDVTLLGVFYDPGAPPVATPVSAASAVAAVPEPTGIALMLLGGLLAMIGISQRRWARQSTWPFARQSLIK
ncbi:MAG TPA: PEP-CTERM sorting domain-containing protein, partial [Mycobacterium sp.]|nr:PEP-CTERM sorting domain-containing protein [Mycobacterium sp.]